MTPTGIDQSWGFADPAACKAAGVEVVSMYLSNDPSKNMTAAKVKAYHKYGIAVLFNWEALAGAPLNGASQGRTDATTAVAQARRIIADVGYEPANRLTIYFSCDRDVSSAHFPALDAYYKAAREVCHAAGYGVGVYGEASLVQHLADAGITDAEWQTYAWSGGVLSPAADFYQYQNGQTLGGASVDFDRVIHAGQLGAWWPTAHALNTEGDDMPTAAEIVDEWLAREIESTKDGTKATLGQFLANGYVNGRETRQTVESIAQILGAAKTGVLARVAALQAAVASIQNAESVDAAAVASTVVDSLKALVWGVK